MSNLPISNCPDGAGSINNPTNGSTHVEKYRAPELCAGSLDYTTQPDRVQEQYAAENLNISGAPINVFKLLGVHEQGKLVDLVGNGSALNGTDKVFDSYVDSWVSAQTGMDVLTAPAWIGYDFGTVKTSYGQEQNAPSAPNSQHITSFSITQPTNNRRALQVRIERSDGNFKAGTVRFTKASSPSDPYIPAVHGSIQNYTAGVNAVPGMFMLSANNATTFTVMFTGATTEVVGIATVGQRFNSTHGSFTIISGTTTFASGDFFSLPIVMDWYRVDVVNVPDTAAAAQIRIKQSAPSRFWRIVPTQFSGVTTNDPWEVDKLELFDYQATTLDDVQDQLFMENRDRDYATQSVQFKVAYQPFDAISDLSKFGFQVADIYSFTTSFATMVKALGRPIVVGDILEVPSEMQYDHNLRPVKKFLEVTDTSWAADGYTTSWRPIIYKFQASQMIPSQENRDIVGTVDTQKYVVDDGAFFDGVEQIQTGPLTASEAIKAEAQLAVPETGTNVREVASGMSANGRPGSYDGRDLYLEDGLPPDGQAYTEGFKLPDVAAATDGEFFRLNYDPVLKIASRLYRFNAVKNKWMYVETDRRTLNNSLKPSQQAMFNATETMSITSKKI